MKPYPLTAQAVYSDLLARLQDDAVSAIRGAPTLIERGGRGYWYASERIGDRATKAYLGPDTPELRERIERAKGEAANLKMRDRERGAMVRMLKQAGYPTADAQTGKVLFALAKAGAFRLRAVLIGSHAFNCYPALLGRPLEAAFARTEDIDLAQHLTISIALDDQLNPDFATVLQTVEAFKPKPSPRDYTKAAGWRGESGAMVELLTTMTKPTDDLIELPALQAHAQPLPFLDYLIHDPVPAALLYRYGVLVSVPQPARYAVHKLIVATRKGRTKDKAAKDIAQAAELFTVMSEDRPDEIEEALAEAETRGPNWKKAIAAGDRRLPKTAQLALFGAATRVPPSPRRSKVSHDG